MKKFVERNLAAIIIALIFVLAFSSCGVKKPYHAPGVTEWNKQYQIKCKSRN